MVRLVIAHKHTHKHLHHPIGAADVRPRGAANGRANRVRLDMYTGRTWERTRKHASRSSEALHCSNLLRQSLAPHVSGGKHLQSRSGDVERARETQPRRETGGASVREGGRGAAGREEMMRRHREAEGTTERTVGDETAERRAGVSRLRAAVVVVVGGLAHLCARRVALAGAQCVNPHISGPL